jgi:transcriptional regulator
MFIQPWDAARDAEEWRAWLGTTDRFGVLVVNNLDAGHAPLVLPTHFTMAGEQILMHLARPNPVWPHLEAAEQVRLAVIGDYAYVPGYWRTAADVPEEHGVPTSYYSSVQFVCAPSMVDDPADKAELLSAQLGDFQPEGRHVDVAVDAEPYGRMLSGIRGVRLTILGVEAKFKYDDHKPLEYRARVNERLEERARGLDARVAAQQRRRLAEIGEWEIHRGRD